MSIQEKLKLLKSGKLTAVQNIKDFLKKIEKENKEINAIIEINKNALKEAEAVDRKIKAAQDKGAQVQAGKLAGLAIAIKSNINVKGLLTSCASKTLDNYYAPYNATVIERIRKEDGIIIGMANMDEFACGSSGETSAFGVTKNPKSIELIPGGSSSGSAAAVSAGFCDLSLGSDTGGSIRNPASHCGVIGLKPSYGLVSRYGLIDLSMSLDQIGPFSNDLYGSALLLSVIAGYDEKDPTTFDVSEDYAKALESKQESFSIGVPDFEKICDKKITEIIAKKLEKLKKAGNKIVPITLKHLNLAVQTYYPICYTEFFSGTRKFDGRKYGHRIEDTCGPEVLRRILGGSEISKAEFTGAFYKRALKAKQLITEELEEAFKKVDCIILPAAPKLPHKIGSKISIEEMYAYDAFTIPSNLAGIPTISVPAGEISKIPVGMQILVSQFQEARMFQIANII
jgi:aspartyl-tRNA(Asn)/glutamyl-tRNA(Gln) amidotransferase subunit A